MPSGREVVVEQKGVIVPDLTVKDLLSAIPEHCFKRSAFRSSLYIVWDVIVIAGIYKATTYLDPLISPDFWTGLFATGLWVVAHECGHQAFSESKTINNAVGWVLHSALGVPYHSWRITHAKHHASTAHMTQDQVFVPRTRSERGLPAFNPDGENKLGSRVTEEVMRELWDALGDSPIGAMFGAGSYLLAGWPSYLIRNASGQTRYPKGTNHFTPTAVMFRPDQHNQIVLSDTGIFFWLAGIATWIYFRGFFEVFRLYLATYLWVNHWLVLITFLQHTDPLLPHYRAPEFTFPRGALATLDRNLLGGCGSIMGWIGAHATHGISETHVLHHVSSKIPHYNAWEATDALRRRLAQAGIELQGAPAGWGEVYRVFKECKFVEDDGNVVFYKNARGLAAARPIYTSDATASDSGVEVDTKL